MLHRPGRSCSTEGNGSMALQARGCQMSIPFVAGPAGAGDGDRAVTRGRRASVAGVRRDLYDDEHEQFRASFRAWLDREARPHAEGWARDGIVPRSWFAAAGRHGFLGMAVPEASGGGGVGDFRFNAVINEEVQASGTGAAGLGLTLHNDICLPYFLRYCTDDQRTRWLPGIASGELITAIAMTEPSIGSDLGSMATTAVRDGDRYLV